MSHTTAPAYITSLIRHFKDLRDGTHGGSANREDKEAHFENAVQLLAPIARQVLNEMNMNLLRDTGQLTESGLRRTPDGGLNASWALSWPEQLQFDCTDFATDSLAKHQQPLTQPNHTRNAFSSEGRCPPYSRGGLVPDKTRSVLADPILTAVHDDCLTGDKGGIVAC
jgi:hypothetical protein